METGPPFLQFFEARNLVFVKMKSGSALFFHAHQNVEAWWYKFKTTSKVPLHAANGPLLPPDEAPGEFCKLKLISFSARSETNAETNS
jgi:hypothetical protein